MEPITDIIKSNKSLVIVDKYYTFLKYVYPMLINMSGKHRVLRDKALEAVIHQISLFNDAAKSNQVGKLYLADSGIASLREYLRILAEPNIKLLSRKQYGVATSHLSEVGAILGAWIKQFKNKEFKVADDR